ncbi:MFS transporter [Nonomuraea angiospora]|uniref:MFS transporter n=1 Tax=Nonomuraea angiospora TaxID=46172 RepID=UPI00332089C1
MRTDVTLGEEPTPVLPRRTRPTLVLAFLALAGVVFAMLQSLVAPALPVIAGELSVSTADISWLVTAYLLAAAIATPVAGRLGDMFGRHRVLLIVLGVLAVGTLVAALAETLAVLVTGRVLQGAGGAILPLAFGIVRDTLPPKRVGIAVGLLSALLGTGGGLGTVLAGPIVATLNWHWLFWFPLILIALAMATSSFALLAVAHDAAWHILTAVTLMGIGIGLASAAMTNAILATVPPSQTSVATSINTLARTIGGSIGTAVLAAVLSANTSQGIPTEAGFTVSFWICSGVLVLAVLAALALPTRRGSSTAGRRGGTS